MEYITIVSKKRPMGVTDTKKGQETMKKLFEMNGDSYTESVENGVTTLKLDELR